LVTVKQFFEKNVLPYWLFGILKKIQRFPLEVKLIYTLTVCNGVYKNASSMNKKELETTAQLALIEVSPDELDVLAEAVTEMISYFTKMKELDVDNLPPTTHALSTGNRVRNDDIFQYNPDIILENAEDLEDRFIVIPNVL
jgi:aspartyl-tRNA(Asn)/glutamyl-tRNA(Gln) amidotransferase subunit C